MTHRLRLRWVRRVRATFGDPVTALAWISGGRDHWPNAPEEEQIIAEPQLEDFDLETL